MLHAPFYTNTIFSYLYSVFPSPYPPLNDSVPNHLLFKHPSSFELNPLTPIHSTTLTTLPPNCP
jgi:hypothetical protein